MSTQTNQIEVANVSNASVISSDKNRDKKLEILNQTQAIAKATKKYGVVTTQDVLKIFVEEGFHYSLDDMKVKGMRSSNYQHKAHVVTLHNPKLTMGDGIDSEEGYLVIYLWNSYDLTKSFQLDVGVFRGFCWNSMAFGQKIMKTIKIKHLTSESTIDNYRLRIREAISEAINVYKNKFSPLVESLMTTQMSDEQMLEFATKAFAARMNDLNIMEPDVKKVLSNIAEIPADAGNSLWQVLNRVQRNLGLNYRKETYQSEITYKFKDKKGNTKIRSLSKITEPTRVTADRKSVV